MIKKIKDSIHQKQLGIKVFTNKAMFIFGILIVRLVNFLFVRMVLTVPYIEVILL